MTNNEAIDTISRNIRVELSMTCSNFLQQEGDLITEGGSCWQMIFPLTTHIVLIRKFSKILDSEVQYIANIDCELADVTIVRYVISEYGHNTSVNYVLTVRTNSDLM